LRKSRRVITRFPPAPRLFEFRPPVRFMRR
jgi:hypothetical protein